MIKKPIFMEEENKKWVEEINNPDGTITYKAKKNAPEEIKKSVNEYNQMIRDSIRYGIN